MNNTKKESFLAKFGFPQSYTSLILGILVVIVAAVLVVGIVKRSGGGFPAVTPPAETLESMLTQGVSKPPSTYTTIAGDTLWAIAEKFYKSGYNWVDIAKENKIENADAITVGMTLTIPNVESRLPTVAGVSDLVNAVTGDKYTVVKDDNLWDIAVRAYGDGFKWVDIVKANNLTNPDVIHAGNELKIPR